MAWTFYLVVALAGGLWIGIARRGPIPLSLFVSPRGWWLDLGAGLELAGEDTEIADVDFEDDPDGGPEEPVN